MSPERRAEKAIDEMRRALDALARNPLDRDALRRIPMAYATLEAATRDLRVAALETPW